MISKEARFVSLYLVCMILGLAVVGPAFAANTHSTVSAPFGEMTMYPGIDTCSSHSNPGVNYAETCSNGQFSGSAEQYAYSDATSLGVGAGATSTVFFDTTSGYAPSVQSGSTPDIYLWEGFSFYGYYVTTSDSEGGVVGTGPGWDVTTTFCSYNSNGQLICNTNTTTQLYFVDQQGGGASGYFSCNSCAIEYYYGGNANQPYSAGGGLFAQANVAHYGSAEMEFGYFNSNYWMSTSYVGISNCQYC